MMLHRIQNRSQTPVINLTLDCEPKGYSVSRNLIAEVTVKLLFSNQAYIKGK